MEGTYARAAYDFQTTEPGEISLRQGDIIKILSRVDESWSCGQIYEQKGNFPSSFVEPVNLPATVPGQKVFAAIENFLPQNCGEDLGLSRGDIILGLKAVNNDWWKGQKGHQTGIFPLTHVKELCLHRASGDNMPPFIKNDNVYIAKAVATMDIQAQLDDELSFNKGDVVNIIECEDGDFCKGECKGKVGSFPVDFVEIIDGSLNQEKRFRSDSGVKLSKTSSIYKESIDDLDTDISGATQAGKCTMSAEASNKLAKVTKEDLAMHNGDANAFNDDSSRDTDKFTNTPPPSYDELMSSTSSQVAQVASDCPGIAITRSDTREPDTVGNISARNSVSSMGHSSNYSSFIGADTDVTPYGITLFPFIAENPNELTFFDNEIIHLIRHVDDQWIEGELDGKTGIFPTSYIEIIVDCAHSNAEGSGDKLVERPESALETVKDELYGLVLYDFNTEMEGDLPVKKGDTVTIIGKYDGWYQARLDNGETGVCPSNYIEIFGAEPEVALSGSASVNAGENICDMQDQNVPKSSEILPFLTDEVKESEANLNNVSTSQLENESFKPSSLVKPPTKPKPPIKPKPTLQMQSTLIGKSKSVDHGIISNNNAQIDKNANTCTKQQRISFNIDANLSLDEIVKKQMAEAKVLPGSSNLAENNLSHKNESKMKDVCVGQSMFYALSANSPKKPVPKRPPKPMSPVKSPSLDNANQTPSYPTGLRPTTLQNTPIVPLNAVSTSAPRPVPMRPAPARPTSQNEKIRTLSRSDLAQFLPSPEEEGLEVDSAAVVDLQKRIVQIDQDIQKYKKEKEEMEKMLVNVSDADKQEVKENIDFFSANIEGLQVELNELNSEKDKMQPGLLAKGQQHQEHQKQESEKRFYEEMKQKRLEKREHVIAEILQTEQDYLKSLQLSIGAFIGPEVKIHPDIDIESLFGNMEEVAEVSQKLLSLLEAGIKGKTFQEQIVGLSFTDMCESMKHVYAPYCRNHDDAIALLEKYDENVEITKFLNAKLMPLKQHINVFSLGALLIKPVQRILKYPLLISELIKATEDDHPDKKHLLEAVHKMTDVATHINEYKRRKDLVYKYKKDTDHSLSDKISKLNIHSIKKKSTRIGQRLSMNLGVAVQTVDENYNLEEIKIKNLEKYTRTLVKDMEFFLFQVKEAVYTQEIVANDIADYYGDCKDKEDVKQFCNTHNVITSQLFDQFKYQADLQVISPLNQLLYRFQAPALIMKKRNDKLLDYDSISSRLKNLKESEQLKADKDLLIETKNTYEALNSQVLDDLPKLYNLGTQLTKDAIGRWVHLHKVFLGAALDQMYQLLGLPLILETKETKVVEKFNIDHVAAVNRISHLSFIPKTFNPSIEDKQKEKVKGRVSETDEQSDSQKAYLRQKYPPDQLWQVDANFVPSGMMEVALPEGTLVGVIKESDPMGNKERWFVDTGVTQCIIPKKFLSPEDATPTFFSKIESLDDDFMDLMDSETLPDFSSDVFTSEPVSPAPYALGQQTLGTETTINTEGSTLPNYSPQSSPNRAPGGGEYYRALYTFAARSPIEVSMTEGQIVIVKAQHDQDGNTEWWRVEAGGQEGYAPSNYLYKMQ